MQTEVTAAYNRKEEASKRLWKAHENSSYEEFNAAGKEWSEAFNNWIEVSKKYPNFVKRKPSQLEEAAIKYSTNIEGWVSIEDKRAFEAGAKYILDRFNIRTYSSDSNELIPITG